MALSIMLCTLLVVSVISSVLQPVRAKNIDGQGTGVLFLAKGNGDNSLTDTKMTVDLSSNDFQLELNNVKNAILPKGSFVRKRQKRMSRLGGVAAAYIRGKQALNFVLSDAKAVGGSRSVRWYEKSGGTERAFKDYDAVHPDPLFEYRANDGALVMNGRVGNKDVMVRSAVGKSPAELKFISGTDDVSVDIITYL